MSEITRESIETNIAFTWRNGPPSESGHLFDGLPQLHEWFELFFVKAGDIAWLIENEVRPAPPRSLVIFNHLEIHKLLIRSNQRFERMKLLFNPNLVRRLEPAASGLLSIFTDRRKGERNVIPLSLPAGEELIGLFRRLDEATRTETPERALIKLTSLLDILVLANRAYRETPRDASGPILADSVGSLLRYIDSHLDGDLSLDRLSRVQGMSRHYLCRLFKRETGSTLHNYILYKRVSSAKLLLDDGVEIPKVTRLCGFGSPARFTAAFKKVVGVSPSAYARTRRTADAGLEIGSR